MLLLHVVEENAVWFTTDIYFGEHSLLRWKINRQDLLVRVLPSLPVSFSSLLFLYLLFFFLFTTLHSKLLKFNNSTRKRTWQFLSFHNAPHLLLVGWECPSWWKFRFMFHLCRSIWEVVKCLGQIYNVHYIKIVRSKSSIKIDF